MIARIAGRLEQLSSGAALIDTGAGLWYEVLVPACDVERLTLKIGQEVVLHTIHTLEGDPSRGGQTPRLIGFATEADRRFVTLLTTVKGIGMRKALRAMARPAGQVAAAIAARDETFLATLPEIGKRTAQLIVAELRDKVDEFAAERPAPAAASSELPAAGAEAVSVLVQLGEKRPDAAALVERVLAVDPAADTAEAIIQKAYRLKAGGAAAV